MMRFEPQPITGQQRHGDAVFPLVLVAEGPLSQQDLHGQSATLMEQLATHGAILFRGCGVGAVSYTHLTLPTICSV